MIESRFQSNSLSKPRTADAYVFDVGWILNKTGCSMLLLKGLSRPEKEVGA